MERDLEDIMKECKAFYELKRQHRYNKFPSAGAPAFLVSREWMKKYKRFILYKFVKCNQKPSMENDHCQKYHPGQITNDADICDEAEKFLRGTGTNPAFENTVYDKYLKSDIKEKYHFKIFNEDLWNFIYSRYGGQEVKRYYIQMGTYYS